VDWDGLIAREGPSVWRAVRRVIGDDAEAEDVFQETFLAAVEVSRREPVRQWRGLLLRLAHARAIDRLRRRYRQAKREASDEIADENFESVVGSGPMPHEILEAGELSARLRLALAKLPEQQAEIFCLFCLEGWTYQQISAELSVSIDVVGVSIHRARAKLRMLLAETDPEVCGERAK
jgi:RNA polymerase sigma-70 factor (ECF subfamily)